MPAVLRGVRAVTAVCSPRPPPQAPVAKSSTKAAPERSPSPPVPQGLGVSVLRFTTSHHKRSDSGHHHWRAHSLGVGCGQVSLSSAGVSPGGTEVLAGPRSHPRPGSRAVGRTHSM